MRTYLLPEGGTFYKANLHCHTIISDGKKTPAEVKELYLKKGYSIVAYTDHDVFLAHNDLTDENFLALNGFEVEIMEQYGRGRSIGRGRCDICYIALEKDNVMHLLWHREKFLIGHGHEYADQVRFDEELKNYSRSYTPECVSEMMEIGRENGFFVTLNHPTWSRENYTYYSKYHGLHAVELMNGGATSLGFDEYNPRVYDDMLRTGKKLYCIGADDNHNREDDDSRYSDSGWAWTVIKAEGLTYESVADALKNGNFYASEGPEIYDLYVEDGKVHIKCSPADRIFCTYQKRVGGIVLAENGKPVTEAVFDANPEYGYFRITVRDERGYHACTNAYFPEDY